MRAVTKVHCGQQARYRTVVVPERQRELVLHEAHKAHAGTKAMLAWLHTRFYWFGMAVDTEEFVRKCVQCQRVNAKQDNRNPKVAALPTAAGPNEVLAIDFVKLPRSLQGNTAILTIIDEFTKWLIVVPTKDETAKMR